LSSKISFSASVKYGRSRMPLTVLENVESEMPIVRGHENVSFADFGQRQPQPLFVGRCRETSIP
jgi:hypothetical protein